MRCLAMGSLGGWTDPSVFPLVPEKSSKREQSGKGLYPLYCLREKRWKQSCANRSSGFCRDAGRTGGLVHPTPLLCCLSTQSFLAGSFLNLNSEEQTGRGIPAELMRPSMWREGSVLRGQRCTLRDASHLECGEEVEGMLESSCCCVHAHVCREKARACMWGQSRPQDPALLALELPPQSPIRILFPSRRLAPLSPPA